MKTWMEAGAKEVKEFEKKETQKYQVHVPVPHKGCKHQTPQTYSNKKLQ